MKRPPSSCCGNRRIKTALRLFVDLYHAQSLPRAGGVHWRTVWLNYTREAIRHLWGTHCLGLLPREVGGVAELPAREALPRSIQRATGATLLRRLAFLIRLGLVAYTPHLIEADTDEAAVLFPVGGTMAVREERALGDAAHTAGLA